MEKTSNPNYEVTVDEAGITHVIAPNKSGVTQDYVLTPGEKVTIDIKGSQTIVDVPLNLSEDTTFLIVGNGNSDWTTHTYDDLSRIKTDEDRLYAFPVGGQATTSGYKRVENLLNDIAAANNIDNPYTVPFGFSGSGIHAYSYANSSDDMVCCIECDPASTTSNVNYKSNGSTYTIILGKNSCNDINQRIAKKGTSEYGKAKNILFIGAAKNYHDEFQTDMGKLGITDFIDTNLDISELKGKLDDYYGENKWTMTLVDGDGKIIKGDKLTDDLLQAFLDEAYDAIETQKNTPKSPNTGENTKEFYDQEKELFLQLSNIKSLKTSDVYEDGVISTKYGSVVNGINNIRDLLRYTDVSTKNPGLNNNQNLNDKLSGFLGCMAYAANNILLDTKNLTDSFGYLLQDYSYLENKLNKSVQDIGEMKANTLVNISSTDVDGLSNPLLLGFEGYKNTYDQNYDISKLRVGGVSSGELASLLSDNGAIKSFFGSEVSNSKELMGKIDNLLSSESQGPGWEEAKSALMALRSNVETRMRTAQYAEGRMVDIFGKLKAYIDANAGSDGYITDANLDSLVSQAAQLSREIMALAMRISQMPDILWIDEKGQPVGNFEKEMLTQELHAKEAALNEINRQISIIEGYRALLQECMGEMNDLLGEISTGSDYYGGLVDIPTVSVSDFEYLQSLF